MLAVVVDTNMYAWSKLGSFKQAMQSMAFFLKASMISNGPSDEEDQLYVVASSPGAPVLYPASDYSAPHQPQNQEESVYAPIAKFDLAFGRALSNLMESTAVEPSKHSISAALSKVLCYANMAMKKNMKPRILVISVSPDDSNTYVSLMNSIFSAQKMSIPIHVCRLVHSESQSVFLKQAVHLTGGCLVELESFDEMLQTLLTNFMVSDPELYKQAVIRYHSSLSSMKAGVGDYVDFRAACFCHRKIVNVGFICSVCLAIYCQASGNCQTCGTVLEERRR